MLSPLLLVLLAPLVRTAIVDPPTRADRLDQFYEKLHKLTPTAPPHVGTSDGFVKLYKKLERFAAPPTTERPIERLYEKLDRLNSLTPVKFFSDDDEELLVAMQEFGMPEEQIDAVVKSMQRKSEGDEYYEELQDLSYGDYSNDGNEDLDPYDEEDPQKDSFVPSMKSLSMTPMDLNREPGRSVFSALDPIAATKERPKILDDSGLSQTERAELKNKAKAHFTAVLRNSKCLTPQPRWLSVQQLAPAADTHYMPPCVQLHRCAPDSGCCRETDVCSPIDGHYVTLPFLLDKVGRERSSPALPANMQFFNHTRCGCVPRAGTAVTRVTPVTRGTPVTPVTSSTQRPVHRTTVRGSAGNPRTTVRGSAGNPRMSGVPTQEPKPENETAAPQLRRCTCPALFLARVSDAGCACVCDWPEAARSRDCLTLSRGREHFGLRDRVCIAEGGCSPPSCAFGTYEQDLGKCPLRRAQSSGTDVIFEHPGDGFRAVTNRKLDP